MKRRSFVIGLLAMPAGKAFATQHESMPERLNNMRDPATETSQNIVLSNVKFIAANASHMDKDQLIKAYAYLKKVFKMRGLSSTLSTAVVDAMVAVEKAWLKGEFGTIADLDKAASKLLKNNPPPFLPAPPKQDS